MDINAGYSRLGGSMTGLSSGMYPSSYPSTEQNPYPSISMENSASAFYGSLVSTSPQHLMYLMYLNQDQGLNWDFPVDLGNSDVWGMQYFCRVVSKMVYEHACPV